MKKIKLLLTNEAKFWWWEVKDNKVPQLVIFLLSAFFLAVLLLGKQMVTNKVTGSYSADGMLIGYLTFILMSSASFIGYEIGRSTHAQLDLSGYGINKVLLVKAIYNTIFTYAKLVFLTIILNFTFNVGITINYFITFLILLIGVIPYYYFCLVFAYFIPIFQEKKLLTTALNILVIATPLLQFLDAYPLNYLSFFPYVSAAATVKLDVIKRS